MMLTSAVFTPVSDALAKDGEYGFLEGRSVALIHPIAMGALFIVAARTGFLGLRTKKIREIPNQIKYGCREPGFFPH